MQVATADIVAVRYRDPNWFNRATEYITGARHHHDELLCSVQGVPHVGYAHMPHFDMLPWSERLESLKAGDLTLAVYRWKDMPLLSLSERERIRHDISTYLRSLALRQLPYDKIGVVTIARNVLRKWLHLPASTWHREYNVWCTETCFQGWVEIGGLPVYRKLGYQAMPSPVHVDRLVRLGELELVYDGGLHERIRAPEESERK
jgi:hypothetical protein